MRSYVAIDNNTFLSSIFNFLFSYIQVIIVLNETFSFLTHVRFLFFITYHGCTQVYIQSLPSVFFWVVFTTIYLSFYGIRACMTPFLIFIYFSMTSSTQSESSSSTVTSNSSPILLANLHHHISLKLTRDNYMLWRFLMTSYLEAQELFGYVDGYTHGPLDCHSLVLHQLLLVNVSLLINGTLDWVILLCGSFVVCLPLISFFLHQIKLLRFLPPVSLENFKNCIFLLVPLCRLDIWTFSLWMYGALPLYFPIIINVIFSVLWMISHVTLGFFLLHASQMLLLCLLISNDWWKISLVILSNLYKQMGEGSLFLFKNYSSPMAFHIVKPTRILIIKMEVWSAKFVIYLILTLLF